MMVVKKYNKLSGYVKGGAFLNQLNDYEFFKWESSAWRPNILRLLYRIGTELLCGELVRIWKETIMECLKVF
jgi:hypothetical protein